MDSWLIFQHPYICDVVTEKANRTGYWIPDQARYLLDRQIRLAQGENVMRSEWGNPSSEVDDASSQEKLLT